MLDEKMWESAPAAPKLELRMDCQEMGYHKLSFAFERNHDATTCFLIWQK